MDTELIKGIVVGILLLTGIPLFVMWLAKRDGDTNIVEDTTLPNFLKENTNKTLAYKIHRPIKDSEDCLVVYKNAEGVERSKWFKNEAKAVEFVNKEVKE